MQHNDTKHRGTQRHDKLHTAHNNNNDNNMDGEQQNNNSHTPIKQSVSVVGSP